MTPSEELFYWIGFGRAASVWMGTKGQGCVLAELIRRAPSPVRADRFPMFQHKIKSRHLTPGSVESHVSTVRVALRDLGLNVPIHCVRVGEHVAYAMSAENASMLRRRVEEAAA